MRLRPGRRRRGRRKDPLRDCGPEILPRVFGKPVDVVLWASTHSPSIEQASEILWVNPGSATLPGDGATKSFARLCIENGAATAEILSL